MALYIQLGFVCVCVYTYNQYIYVLDNIYIASFIVLLYIPNNSIYIQMGMRNRVVRKWLLERIRYTNLILRQRRYLRQKFHLGYTIGHLKLTILRMQHRRRGLREILRQILVECPHHVYHLES